jgi:hypothetical protein
MQTSRTAPIVRLPDRSAGGTPAGGQDAGAPTAAAAHLAATPPGAASLAGAG